MIFQVRDLETLVSSVRNPASRRQLEEVVRAYQGGAFRAAIISTWVAVALDIVSKLREIADDGDQGAVSEIATLDAAVVASNVAKLQKFENGLLDLCRDKFELINGREHLVLSRLMHDRNSCAHPAFVSPDDVFAPTAELARSHLVAAVDAVLQHPPTPGKRIVHRFQAEIESSAWPASHDELVPYLRERYFGRQRESAKRQLALLILKCCMSPPADVTNRSRLLVRYPECARALSDVTPALFEEALGEVVRKREETVGLSEAEIRSSVGALGDTVAFWEAVPAASGPRLVKCIETSSVKDLVESGVLAILPPDAGVGSKVREVVDRVLVEGISASQLADALALRASPHLVEETINRVEHSGSWSTTNYLMPLLPALVQFLDVDQVVRLCSAASSNYEIYQAHTADEEFRTMFELTHHWQGVRDEWINVARFAHPYQAGQHAAFPLVRAAVTSKWGDEVLVD